MAINEKAKQQVLDQVEVTSEVLALPEVKKMIEGLADITWTFYSYLVEQGMSQESAALVTAHYTSQLNAVAAG